ncbi:unnamed protein product [Paramecium pentaurelia]|uniref:Uncharacterized protein n=1 Tax=Paramecium pentaurelia TaxID=43138 RepID=A0A8S1YME9_9CILI|nr:unnamed protein product [Paramecium pentaurelia]
MQKQPLKLIQTPSTYVTKTPEKAINTSPFRGCSFSDKQQMTPLKYNMGYPQVQQTINQNLQPQFPYYENTSPFRQETKEQLLQRILNLEDNLRVINRKYDQLKEELDKERIRKCETDRSYSQLYQKCQDYEKDFQKQQQMVKGNENKYKQIQKELIEYKEKLSERDNEIIEQKTVQEKFQRILKQKEKEINELKQKLKEEKDLRLCESDRLIQEFSQTYSELSQQNDQLIQENNELKIAILEFDNQGRSLSSKKQSEQNFQTNTDFLDDPELRQIIQEYLTNNDEYYLHQIPEKQLRTCIQIIKDIFQTIPSRQLKEIKSQQFQQPKQINEEIEINLQEVRKKREFLIKEIKQKMERIVKQKEFNIMEFNDLQREIEELKKELSSIENLIQQMEQSLLLNPHRNSCVSFDNEEFQ